MGQESTDVSRLIGPEDVAAGDFVTVSHETLEVVPWGEIGGCDGGGVKAVRVEVLSERAGRALKVVAVCRPWVLVEEAWGECCALDLRSVRLARLSGAYGKAAFKLMGGKKGKRK